MIEPLAHQLIRHEGIRLKAYTCPAGKTTIGVGRNLDDKGISKSEAMAMLISDITEARNDVDQLLAYYRISKWMVSKTRLDVLANMAFNLGIVGLGGFKQMWAFIRAENYQGAAAEMLNSKWAGQVGERARELAKQMETNNYQRPQI